MGCCKVSFWAVRDIVLYTTIPITYAKMGNIVNCKRIPFFWSMPKTEKANAVITSNTTYTTKQTNALVKLNFMDQYPNDAA